MRPPLEEQVAPAPWLVAGRAADVPARIKKVLNVHPNASVDEIVGQLAAWRVQVSGIIVSMWMMKWKEHAERESSNQISRENTDDLYWCLTEQIMEGVDRRLVYAFD